jgi:multiple sugar transport system substrate-binding protein
MQRGIVIAFLLMLIASGLLFSYLTSDEAAHYLVFATWGTPAEISSFQRLIEHYNAARRPRHPVKLSHAEQYQYTERLLVQAAARSIPDVIHLDRKDIPLFVQRGLLEELTPLMKRDTSFSTDVFFEELLAGCRVGTRYFALPHNFSTLLLYYNKDHFDAEGMRYPDSTWNWSSLLDAAQRLTRRDASGKIVRYGCLMQIVQTTLIEQNGGRVLNEALDSCVIASPEAEGALQFAVDLSEKHHVTWNMLAQNLQWDDLFAGGRLSMIANGRWAAVLYAQSMAPGVVDVAPLPRGKFRKSAAASHVMAISAGSAKREEAWEFLKFLVSEEGERMVNEEGANIPAVRSIATSDEFLHHRATPAMNNRVFLDELPFSTGWPFEVGPYVSTYTLQSQFELAVRRVLLGHATVSQSLKIMEAEVNTAIRAQRRVAQPKPFVGSVAFLACTGIVVATVSLAWYRRRRGRHRRADRISMKTDA